MTLTHHPNVFVVYTYRNVNKCSKCVCVRTGMCVCVCVCVSVSALPVSTPGCTGCSRRRCLWCTGPGRASPQCRGRESWSPGKLGGPGSCCKAQVRAALPGLYSQPALRLSTVGGSHIATGVMVIFIVTSTWGIS